MRAVKIFAMYESSDDADAKARCVEAIEAMLEDEGSAEDATTDERCATRRVFERAFEGRDRDHGLAVAESAESRALANGDEWFYGELEFDAARALLRRCAPNGESGEFVDLGSGLGEDGGRRGAEREVFEGERGGVVTGNCTSRRRRACERTSAR